MFSLLLFYSNINLPVEIDLDQPYILSVRRLFYYNTMFLTLSDELCFIGCFTSILIMHNLEEARWLVESSLWFTIMAVMIQSIPTDGTID